jgi:hypothetical protein
LLRTIKCILSYICAAGEAEMLGYGEDVEGTRAGSLSGASMRGPLEDLQHDFVLVGRNSDLDLDSIIYGAHLRSHLETGPNSFLQMTHSAHTVRSRVNLR